MNIRGIIDLFRRKENKELKETVTRLKAQIEIAEIEARQHKKVLGELRVIVGIESDGAIPIVVERWKKEASIFRQARNNPLRALCRDILGSVDVKRSSEILIGLSKDNRRAYAAQAQAILNSPVFNLVVDYVMNDQARHAGLETKNWDETVISRGSINGASLVEEQMEEIAQEHIAVVQEQADDNKLKGHEHDVIPPS